MARSLPTTVNPIVKKKEIPILKKGAEGKLLVPDVKLKVSTSYLNVSASPSHSSSQIVRRTSEFSDGSMTSVNGGERAQLQVARYREWVSSLISFFARMLISSPSTRVVV